MTHPGPAYALASILAMVSTLISTSDGSHLIAGVVMVLGLAVFAIGVRIHYRNRSPR